MKRTVLNERQQAIVMEMARGASDQQILAVMAAVLESPDPLGFADREALRELVRRYVELNGAKAD